MATNYEKMELAARALFLQSDQQAAIARWDLRHDGDYLYFHLFSQPVKLDRRTAELLPDGPCDYSLESTVNESMAVFDLLTLSPRRPRAKGTWSSISGLGGVIGAGHDRTLGHEGDAARFAGHPEALARACRHLGGTPETKADVGFAIPVFADFRILFQFWDGDEEFPAQIKYLFDENALQYMHYETLWYVMGAAMSRLTWYYRQEQGLR